MMRALPLTGPRVTHEGVRMRTRSLTIATVAAACLMMTATVIVASPSGREAAPACSGPDLCGKTCSLDPFGTPIYCSNGQCVCPPGYDTDPGPPIVCQPRQPEFMPSTSDDVDCSQNCTSNVWAIAGGISNPFDLVAVHGT